tara:strand:+ start:457 stop:714 length:258 start_codon:yes stop_codon:yes gene_type:complete
MKIYLLSHLIKYYFPWLIPIVRKSKHIDLLNKIGFRVISIIPEKTYPSDTYINGSIHRNQLAKRFIEMTEEDFTTCSAHILSIKD